MVRSLWCIFVELLCGIMVALGCRADISLFVSARWILFWCFYWLCFWWWWEEWWWWFKVRWWVWWYWKVMLLCFCMWWWWCLKMRIIRRAGRKIRRTLIVCFVFSFYYLFVCMYLLRCSLWCLWWVSIWLNMLWWLYLCCMGKMC